MSKLNLSGASAEATMKEIRGTHRTAYLRNKAQTDYGTNRLLTLQDERPHTPLRDLEAEIFQERCQTIENTLNSYQEQVLTALPLRTERTFQLNKFQRCSLRYLSCGEERMDALYRHLKTSYRRLLREGAENRTTYTVDGDAQLLQKFIVKYVHDRKIITKHGKDLND